MRKVLSLLVALLAFGGNVWADVDVTPMEGIFTVGDNAAEDPNVVELKKGVEGEIVIYVHPGDLTMRDSEFDILLPEKISVAKSGDVVLAYVSDAQPKNPADPGSKLYSLKATQSKTNPQLISCVVSCTAGEPVNEGALIILKVTLDESLIIGEELTGTMTGNNDKLIISGEDGNHGYTQDAFTFNIKIIENITILEDTKSYDDFAPETNAKVQVKRAIKADTWNTICLPFAMSASQISTVFGSDAIVADFSGCEGVYDEDEEIVVGIKSTFTTVSQMEAHHPYLLKVPSSEYAKSQTEGFIVEGVNIQNITEGDDLQVGIKYTSVVDGKKKWNYFIGNYSPIEGLGKDRPVAFISGNKFYIANGSTNMKGFRGYFDFGELRDYMEYKGYSANLTFFVDDEQITDGIEGITDGNLPIDGVYDLQGRKVEVGNGGLNGLQKGLYIVNGKKVSIK